MSIISIPFSELWQRATHIKLDLDPLSFISLIDDRRSTLSLPSQFEQSVINPTEMSILCRDTKKQTRYLITYCAIQLIDKL